MIQINFICICIYTYITVCVLCPLSASMDRQVPAPPTTSPVAMMNIGEDTGEDSLIPSPSPASMPTQATKGSADEAMVSWMI